MSAPSHPATREGFAACPICRAEMGSDRITPELVTLAIALYESMAREQSVIESDGLWPPFKGFAILPIVTQAQWIKKARKVTVALIDNDEFAARVAARVAYEDLGGEG